MNSLLKMLRSLIVCSIMAVSRLGTQILLKRGDLSSLNLSKLSKLFELSRISAELYFLFHMSRFMPSINLHASTMRALLICTSRQCKSQIHLF